MAFCAHALELDDILVVADAKLDPRFAHNPFVLGPPFIRFYAGMPLVTPGGHVLGTLCILDHRPRHGLSTQDREHLKALALVSRTMRDAAICQKLRANTDPAKLYAILTEGRASQAA